MKTLTFVLTEETRKLTNVTRSAVDDKGLFVVTTLTESVQFGIENMTDIIIRSRNYEIIKEK